ncbi:MAG: hypothetical protein LW825_00150 [Candidatus Jidaibacter sp.]|jgi:hypothetical protein|nr:hypothetical protein [Candidatus Jidaibacter sp.]
MKKNFKLIIVIVVAIGVFANLIYTRSPLSGPRFFDGETYLRLASYSRDLVISGPFRFYEIKANGDVKVTSSITSGKKGTFNLLQITGPAQLEDVNIEHLELTGSLDCKKGIIKKYNVIGPAILANVKIDEMVQTGSLEVDELTADNALIIGSANMKYSIVKQLNITADTIVLEDSQIDQITIKATDTNAKQTITLLGETIIAQDIIFESGTGEVVVKSNKVRMQNVVGGKRIDQPASS